jgi:imidazole glycerol-phosphate synthase subunit HisH
MIAVVDYGIGNLGSVLKAFRHAGAPAVLTEDPAVLAQADALVLPGDGAFGATMDEIERRGLAEPLRAAAAEGRTLLGICIGMQVLFEESEEHGLHRGLGLLPGRVRHLDVPLPVPHMGWNRLRFRGPHPLLEGIADGAHVYFVHSYYCDAPASVVLADTDYGRDVPAVVGRGNVMGVQFHPEKSQHVGLHMVANFVTRCLTGAGLSQTGAQRHAVAVSEGGFRGGREGPSPPCLSAPPESKTS